MVRITGKRAVFEMLKAEGVEYVFGNPGTTETPLMDELESHPEFKYVLALQEGTAMGMADGYARATGSPAFVNLHIETGLANGMSLLHNANQGGTPLVLSAGNLDVRALASGRTDLAELARPFTKFTAEATHPEQVPGLMRRAFNEAKTPPMGPAFVGFSANALDDEGEMDIYPSPRGLFRAAPDARAVEEAAALLASSDNPVMTVGDRVAQSGAAAEAVRVAELLGARVYASSYSEMNFPTTHPQYLGSPSSGEVDAVLAVGKLAGYSMLSGRRSRLYGPDTKLVHLDVGAGGVGSDQPTHVGIVADPKVALAELAAALEASMSGSAREAAKGRAVGLASEKAAMLAAERRRIEERWRIAPMSAERMMAELAGAVPGDAVIVNDAITSGAALLQAFDFVEPGSIHGERGGAIGWGMGGALGVKLANPDRPVVAFAGDGSAMMTIQGLWTAANSDIPVVYVICNNSAYRILKVNMDLYKDQVLGEDARESRYMGMDFPIRSDFAGIAEAMGVKGRRVEDPEELRPAMQEALSLGGPALLDVIIDGSL